MKSPLAALHAKGIGAVEIHCVDEGQEASTLSDGDRNHDPEIQAEKDERARLWGPHHNDRYRSPL